MKYNLTKLEKSPWRKTLNSKSFKLNVLKILINAKKCPKNSKYYPKNVLNILKKKHVQAFLNSFFDQFIHAAHDLFINVRKSAKLVTMSLLNSVSEVNIGIQSQNLVLEISLII